MDQVEEVKGVKLLATSIEDVDMNGLRELGDNLKEKIRRRCHCPCFPERRKSILSCHGNRRGTESRSTRWKPDQSDRRMRWRRRWRTSKYGSGRRKESSRNSRSSSKSKRNFRKSNFIVDKNLKCDILI